MPIEELTPLGPKAIRWGPDLPREKQFWEDMGGYKAVHSEGRTYSPGTYAPRTPASKT